MKLLGDAATQRIKQPSFCGATWRETADCHREDGGKRSLMGEVVPVCGAGAHQDHRPGESDESRSRASLHGQLSLRL